jgi:ribose 5-phosphate isomerase B
MKIYIGTDHRGVEVEQKIVEYLISKSIEVYQSSIFHNDNDDYVDFAKDICMKVVNDEDSFGILICGTGIGMSIAANKIKGIRAARCASKDDAYLTRLDNDANVLCISYKLDFNEIIEIIETFINTEFSNEERHIRRVNKIKDLENGE